MLPTLPHKQTNKHTHQNTKTYPPPPQSDPPSNASRLATHSQTHKHTHTYTEPARTSRVGGACSWRVTVSDKNVSLRQTPGHTRQSWSPGSRPSDARSLKVKRRIQNGLSLNLVTHDNEGYRICEVNMPTQK